MSGPELDAVLQRLYNAPPGGPSPTAIRQFLRLVRETRSRRSEAVCQFGTQFLLRQSASLPEDERWMVYEQVVMASLDCRAFDRAHALIQTVINKFPDSKRAERLMGMYFEATGNETEAKALYERHLGSDPAQPLANKRMVAMHRAKGNLTAAIEQLGKYLQLSPLDAEAWEELLDLYCMTQQYSQAVFCCEELLLLSPASVTYQLRYAEVLYTLGGAEKLQDALTYYSSVTQLTAGENLRALYGLCACSAALAAQQSKSRGSNSANSSEAEALGPLSAQQLLQLYAKQQSELVPMVKHSLKLMGLDK